MVYQECGNPCINTCSNPDRTHVCEERCLDGCFCPAGSVWLLFTLISEGTIKHDNDIFLTFSDSCRSGLGRPERAWLYHTGRVFLHPRWTSLPTRSELLHQVSRLVRRTIQNQKSETSTNVLLLHLFIDYFRHKILFIVSFQSFDLHRLWSLCALLILDNRGRQNSAPQLHICIGKLFL